MLVRQAGSLPPQRLAFAESTPLGCAELAAVIVVISSMMLTAYALLAGRARRLFSSTRSVWLVNRGSGVVMAGAAAAIAMR